MHELEQWKQQSRLLVGLLTAVCDCLLCLCMDLCVSVCVCEMHYLQIVLMSKFVYFYSKCSVLK